MENKIVEIKPIIKSTAFIKDTSHVASFLAPGATNNYTVPLSNTTGRPIKILTDEERKQIEEAIEVDLNHNKASNNYFSNYTVSLGKSTTRLNLNDPYQFLDFKILKANKLEIAPSKSNINDKGTYKYYIVDSEVEAESDAKESDFEEKLYTYFGQLKRDRKKMIKFMELKGKNVDHKNVKDDFLIQSLRAMFIKNNKESQKEFIRLMEDKNFETRLLISKALKTRAISKDRNNYSLEGGEIIAHSIEELVKYLNDNQETRVLIEERVKNAE